LIPSVRMDRRHGRIAAAWGASIALALARSAEELPWDTMRMATFEAAWSTVNEAHFDPTFGGVDWIAVRERYRPRIAGAGDVAALRRELQQMLGELRQSHCALVPREVAVFSTEERERAGVTGIELASIDGQVVVARVRPASPAERAGVRAGAPIVALNGFDPAAALTAMREAGMGAAEADRYLAGVLNSRLQGPVGREISLVARLADGNTVAFALEAVAHAGEWAEPIGNYPALPIEFEGRRLEGGAAYMRLSAFAPALMKQVRSFVRGLEGCTGLAIDLRGNPGGVAAMAAGVAGMLIDRELSLGSTRLRRGVLGERAYPQSGAWRGPVAVLIDGGSASTSEILAAGLRDHGRARIFGERSAGAALPSAFKRLPNGDLLQYAIGEVRTPRGRILEGNGVEPDEPVKQTVADLVAGRDRVVEAALEWIGREAGRRSRAETGGKIR
jgi:carboxyl-terminal processing protease